MSNPLDTLPAGQVRFLDSYQPGLADGAYTLAVTQTVSAPGVTVPDISQKLVVAGPTDVHVEFPPNGSSGQFEEVLPHIVFTKRLLPWERDVLGLPAAVPWLALLVLQANELLVLTSDHPAAGSDTGGCPDAGGPPYCQVYSDSGNGAQTVTVQQLLDAGSARICVPQIDPGTLLSDELASKCQVITIRSETFAQIVATSHELPYLAHVREVDTAGKVQLDLKDAGLFSVLVANRFPQPGSGQLGAKNVVHLVSLEGFGDFLGGTAPVQPTQPYVQMVSLFSWTFSCLQDASQTFMGLAQTLANDNYGGRATDHSLLLRMPYDTPAGSDPSAADLVKRRLSGGYAALGYHARSGEDGFAWYRGPLTPVVTPALHDGIRPFLTADAAMVYDPDSGLFDNSLAAAWQIGRQLALADRPYATALMRLREAAGARLHQLAHRPDVRLAAAGQPAHTALAALVTGGGLRRIGQASCAPANGAPPQADRRKPHVRATGHALRAALALPEVRAVLAETPEDDPDMAAVAGWLGRLLLLIGVPFVHLVSDARMLPPESIRFFYLDSNWLAALLDGALGFGLGTTHALELQRALTGRLEQNAWAQALAYRANALGGTAPEQLGNPLSGLLIRSALASGWPGLTIAGTAKGQPVALLRFEHLANEVMIALFNGVPDTVTLTQPHEGLEFGVDDAGNISTRTVAGDGQVVDTGTIALRPQSGAAGSVLRTGGQRVLNINIDPAPDPDPPTSPVDLLGAIGQALSLKRAELGPAAFALQMIKGPEELTFSLSSASEPERHDIDG